MAGTAACVGGSENTSEGRNELEKWMRRMTTTRTEKSMNWMRSNCSTAKPLQFESDILLQTSMINFLNNKTLNGIF